MNLVFLLFQVDIEKKMQEAPDSSYEIGVVIGSYLPFVVLAGVAYAILLLQQKEKRYRVSGIPSDKL